jgi:hypothetical protein
MSFSAEMEIRQISLHFGNVARRGFNFSFLRGSVRKARKNMPCVKFIQSCDWKEELMNMG